MCNVDDLAVVPFPNTQGSMAGRTVKYVSVLFSVFSKFSSVRILQCDLSCKKSSIYPFLLLKYCLPILCLKYSGAKLDNLSLCL